MANKEFPTDFDAVTSLAGTELVLLDQSGTKKATSQAVANLCDTAIWRRYGTVLEPENGVDLAGIQEISVIYEENPLVIPDTGQSVFKAWYTGGFGGTRGLCYAESNDALVWTKHETAGEVDYVLDDLIHASVVKDGNTYYAFGADSGSLTLDVYSSADGITWTLVKEDAAPRPSSGTAWNRTYYGNIFAWKEGSTWYILAEALGNVSGVAWSLGLFTTTNLAGTWTENPANPVLTRAAGTIGGPFVTKVGTRYWLWAHGNDGSGDNAFPSDIYRYYSDNLTSWTQSPADRPVLRRSQLDGSDSATGQAADPWLVEANGVTYLFYEGSNHGGNPYTLFRGKVAISDHTIAELVTLAEDSDGFEPPRYGLTGSPVRLGAAIASATTITNGNFPNLVFTDTAFKGTNGITLPENGFDSGRTTWTCPRSGWYRIRLSISLTSATTAGMNVIIGFINAIGQYTPGGKASHYIHAATDTPVLTCETFDFYNRGDTLTFRVNPVGGNVTITNNGETFLSIEESPVV